MHHHRRIRAYPPDGNFSSFTEPYFFTIYNVHPGKIKSVQSEKVISVFYFTQRCEENIPG